MINILLNFAKKAGLQLKKQQNNINIIGHKDSNITSIVTKSDISISNLFEETITKHFSNLDFMIIDEEKISTIEDIFKKIEQTEYQFVIDPIDGTIQYANSHPLYGISIGVFKKQTPIMGIIYLPAINELIYSNGTKAFLVKNAFKKNEKTTELTISPSSAPIIFCNQHVWEINDKNAAQKTLLLNYFSAVSQSFYTLTGKSKAYCMHLKLWDIAGTIPIAKQLGLKIFEYGTSKTYDKISAEYFTNTMDTKKHCILCHPNNYEETCSFIKPIQK